MDVEPHTEMDLSEAPVINSNGIPGNAELSKVDNLTSNIIHVTEG